MSSAGRNGEDLFKGVPSRSSPSFLALCDFCDRHAAAVEAALPWLAAEVSRNDGHAAMLDLVQSWSGARLYIAGEHGRFSDKVGCGLGPVTHFRLLDLVGAGCQVEVPSAWGVFLALRRVAISIAVRSGMPTREVSRQFGVTMRSLR